MGESPAVNRCTAASAGRRIIPLDGRTLGSTVQKDIPLIGQIQSGRIISSCPSNADILVFGFQNHTDEQGNSRRNTEDNDFPGEEVLLALLLLVDRIIVIIRIGIRVTVGIDRRTSGSGLQVCLTISQERGKSLFIIAGAQIGNTGIRNLLAGIVRESCIGNTAMTADIIRAVFHREDEQDAVPIVVGTEAVLIIDIFTVGFRIHAFGSGIDSDVDSGTVLTGQLFSRISQLINNRLAERAGRINDCRCTGMDGQKAQTKAYDGKNIE